MSAKRSAAPDDIKPHSKRAKPPLLLPKPALNRLDCNLDFTIELDGITGSALHNEGFAYCWSGARANIGVKAGRYCFGCTVLENQTVAMEDTAKDQRNVCRVGFSRGDNDVGSLGESLHSFGYGGTGKFSSNGAFLDYGGRFGVGDTIICAVDLESHPRAKVAFAKNGVWLGVAKEFDASPGGHGIVGASGYERAFFPHVLLKNVKVRVLLSIDHGLMPLEGYKAWDSSVNDNNAVEGPKAADTSNCEVIMMVGLPGSGKTTWAERWAKEHPEKRYMLLGTNLALDQMKVPGLLRKKNYGERFDRLMDRASKIFNQLLVRAAKTPRNYILDQTNVYRSARIRKLKPFRDFRKVAVVVFPHPEELKRRTLARVKEMGKEVPEDAVNDMLANYVLPNTKGMLNAIEPFDEVCFVELQRDDAECYLAEMKSTLPPKSFNKVESKPTSSIQGSFQDRNAREDSYVSIQGNYPSSYELQDCNVREALYAPAPPASYAPVPQASYAPVPQASYAPAPQNYGSPYLYLDRSAQIPCQSFSEGQLNTYNCQGSLADRYSRDGSVQSYFGDREGHVAADRYSRESSVHSYRDNRQGSLAYHNTRESSFQSHHGDYSSPFGRASQVPSEATLGHGIPAQILHPTALAGDYSGCFTSNAGIGSQMHSPSFSHYRGAVHVPTHDRLGPPILQNFSSPDPYLNIPPASRPGQPMPPMRFSSR